MHADRSSLVRTMVALSFLAALTLWVVLANSAGQGNNVAATMPLEPSAQATTIPSGPGDPSEAAPISAGERQLPSGGVAIKPTIDNPGPGMAAFTAADVEGYITAAIARNELYLGHRIQYKAPPQIVKIEFLTDRDLRARAGGTSTGLPDDAPLYYVELTGTFELTSPNGTPQTLHTGVLVFNAQTGNIMMAGARP